MLKVAPYLTRTGALLFVSAESNNKSNDGTDHAHEREQITVCNHTHQLLSEKSGSWSIAPSVPRVSILYCQGGAWWDEVSRNEPAVLTVIGDFAKMFDPLLNNFITVGLNHSHDTP